MSHAFFRSNQFQDRHINLAWGQIGISAPQGEKGSVSSLSNMPEEVVREILSKSAGSSKPIFFPIQEYNASVPSCLYTVAEIPDVTLSAWEIGILLSDSL